MNNDLDNDHTRIFVNPHGELLSVGHHLWGKTVLAYEKKEAKNSSRYYKETSQFLKQVATIGSRRAFW